VIGVVLAAVIGAIGFFNDLVMHQTFLFGSYMPIFVYGVAILFVVSLNPLLAKIRGGAALRRTEIALICALGRQRNSAASRSLHGCRLQGHGDSRRGRARDGDGRHAR
jgi:hypothetical protein